MEFRQFHTNKLLWRIEVVSIKFNVCLKCRHADLWEWSNPENFLALGQEGTWGLLRDFRSLSKDCAEGNRGKWQEKVKSPSHFTKAASCPTSLTPRNSACASGFTASWSNLCKSCHLVLSLQTCHLGRAEWFTSLSWWGICSSNPHSQRK